MVSAVFVATPRRDAIRMDRIDRKIVALLQDDATLSLAQIAHRVGYSHVSNFTTAFSRRYGAPPLRYRRGREEENG